jgi:uncharacterized membrane protein YkoI
MLKALTWSGLMTAFVTSAALAQAPSQKPATHPTAAPAAQQQPAATPATQEPKVTEATPGLLAKATVPADSAEKIALAQVAGSHVTRGSIRQEGQELVYTFRLAVANSARARFIRVNAMTGKVVTVARRAGTTSPKH